MISRRFIVSVVVAISVEAAYAETHPDTCLQKQQGIAASERAGLCAELIRSGPRQHLSGYYNSRGGANKELGNFDAARADYGRAIEIDPRNEVAHFNRGNIFLEREDYKAALADFDRAIALDPKDHWAMSGRASALHGLDRNPEALQAIERALALAPRSASYFTERGVILAETAGLKAAVESFDQALSIDPNAAVAFEERGTAYLKLRRRDEARADFERAFGLDPERLEPNRFLCSIGSDDRPVRPLDHCDKALKIDPDDSTIQGNRAVLLYRKGDLAGAIGGVDKALEIAPEKPILLVNRAGYFADAGLYGAALADLDKALALDPNRPSAITEKARLAVISGDFRAAEAKISDVLARRPDHADALCVRGWAALAQGRLESARVDFDIALALPRGDHPDTQTGRVRWTALYGRSITRRRSGDVSGSDADLAEARAAHPNADRAFAAWGIKLAGPDSKGTGAEPDSPDSR